MRLKEVLNESDSDEERGSDDDDTEKDDIEVRCGACDKRKCDGNRYQVRDSLEASAKCCEQMFTFEDVKNALEIFSGDKGESIKHWIENLRKLQECADRTSEK